MRARLQRVESPVIFAADAALQGWAVVKLRSGGAFPDDTGLSSSVVDRGLMRCRWNVARHKLFRSRLANILPGEITATRHGSSTAAADIEK